MEIRRATSRDADALTRLAHESKSHWGYPRRWIELWSEELTITPELIAKHPVYLAEKGSEVLGCFALMAHPVDASKWTLEHFWVHPGSMGRGVGRALFERARALAREGGAVQLEIDADPNAEPFYLRMGARRVGEVRTEIEGQPRVRPLLHLDLREAGSPPRPL